MGLLFGVLLINGLLIEPKVFTHKDKVYPSSTHPDLTLYQVPKDRVMHVLNKQIYDLMY